MLKSFGKDVPVETKCVSLTALWGSLYPSHSIYMYTLSLI